MSRHSSSEPLPDVTFKGFLLVTLCFFSGRSFFTVLLWPEASGPLPSKAEVCTHADKKQEWTKVWRTDAQHRFTICTKFQCLQSWPQTGCSCPVCICLWLQPPVLASTTFSTGSVAVAHPSGLSSHSHWLLDCRVQKVVEIAATMLQSLCVTHRGI